MLVNPTDFGLASLRNHMSQFLTISFSLCLSLFLHTQAHTLLSLLLWRTLLHRANVDMVLIHWAGSTQFPTAAVTNDPQLVASNSIHLLSCSLRGQKSDTGLAWQNQGVGRASFLL